MENRQLSIPIYLNQKIVFDLITILEQGSLNISTANMKYNENRAELTEAFSLLNLVTKNDNQEKEYIYTPSSLFSKLRDELMKREFLKIIDQSFDMKRLRSGDFVEFSAVLRKNPLVETFEGFIELMEVGILFEGFSSGGNQKSKSKSNTSTQLTEIKKFFSKINSKNTLDLLGVIDCREENIQAVVPVEYEYFNNKTPAELIDGRFTVLGKTIRNLDKSSDEGINLLRSTSLGLLPVQYRNQFIDQLSQISTMGLDFPDLVTEVESPAIQVIPIAIYI